MGVGWGSFLNTYTLVTRREARDADATSLLAQAQIPDLTTRLSETREAFDRMAFDRMAFDRMAFDRMAFDRMAFDRMAFDRMASGANGKNPIHSMRNPPVIFFPSQCIRDRENVIAAQEQFWEKAKSKN
jgi:hypothetical protein